MSSFDLYVDAGDLRTGVWCDHCLTSAAVEADLRVEAADGRLLSEQVWSKCLRCDTDEDG